MKMHLNKIITESKINNNPKNATSQLSRKMKTKGKNLMRTLRPVTKEIKIKRKYMENPELFQKNYISIQKKKVIHNTQKKLII